MSSRQEEKERRRQERIAREQQQATAASRRRRLQYAFGGLLGVAAIAAVVVLVVSSGGGGGGDPSDPQQPGDAAAAANLPQQQTGDLTAAAKAAGCKLENPPIDGGGHDTKDFKASDYKTNPPTSGSHNPEWYQDGIYAPGDVPRLGMQVHPLEHGRIVVQYKQGTPAATVTQLEALLAEQEGGYHMLLFENTTDMPAAVAATAWGHSVTCPAMSGEVFDALRTFRARYIDKGPETVA